MSKPLYIVWQESFLQDEPIIDEQHRGVLATINTLHHFLQQGHGLDVLKPTVQICLSYIRFHAKTEEGILRAAGYPQLDELIKKNEQIVDEFKQVYREAFIHEDPDLVLHFLRVWWQEHMILHKEITPRLVDYSGQFCRLDT